MGRRELGSIQDPDVEASSADLERLKGEKANTQNETLSIAANKKKLEEDFEVEKGRIAKEVEEARKDSELKIATYYSQCSKLKDQRDTAEKEAQESKEIAIREIQKLNKIQQDIVETQKEFDSLKGQINTLHKDIAQAVEELRTQQDSIKGFSVRESSLKGEITKWESDVVSLQGKYKKLSEEYSFVKDEHENISSSLKNKTESSIQIDKDIANAQKKLSDLKAQLSDVQKQGVEQTAAMQKEKAERDVQMGNAARLFERVDKHLSSLRELEKQFSTEHLARFGYKKLTE